jgi:GNAT superfamily N-acetyltransferase
MTDGKLPAVTSYAMHARNAAEMWTALAECRGEVLMRSERVRIVAPSPYHTLRAIVLDPDAASVLDEVAGVMHARTDAHRRIVEDPSGELDLSGYGFTPRFRMPVMAREPGTAPAVPASDVEVFVVEDPPDLAVAERVIVAVFPPGGEGAQAPGRSQPVEVLGIPGWRVWLGCRDGVPAGATYTYHDGTTVGVYQVATLPEHRGHGVATALMNAVLDAYPDVPVMLTATDHGQPLYDKLGFRTVSEAVWWTPVHTGDDSGPPLR